jgi:two-component system response regulator YesN
MYRVLIVDDEAYFRQYLKTSIDWAGNGFELCGEASSGEEALSLIPQLAPQILLADIHMTGMDGLEMIQRLHQSAPMLSVVIITGYNEFEFARQALRLGVCNFLSKPFEKQELTDSLCAIKRNLEDRTRQEEILSTLRRQRNDSLDALRASVLQKIVSSGFETPEALRCAQENAGLQLPAFPCIVVCAENGMAADAAPLPAEEIKKSLGLPAALYWQRGSRLYGILPLPAGGEPALEDACSRMIRSLGAGHGGSLSLGIGTLCPAPEQLPESCRNAENALRNKFILGGNHVISYTSLKSGNRSAELYPFALKNDLTMYARLLDWEKVQNTLNTIYRAIRENEVGIDFVYILYAELLSTCFAFLSEYGYRSEAVFGADFSPFETLLRCQTAQQAGEYVTGIFHTAIMHLCAQKSSRSMDAVKKAKEYIDQQYGHKSLSVEEISANVFFHPSYLRFLFKNEIGMTINEYLTKVRMEHAKELVQQGGYTQSGIAELVGYSDAAYFSKCFKKYYGMNPSDYEKNQRSRAGSGSEKEKRHE